MSDENLTWTSFHERKFDQAGTATPSLSRGDSITGSSGFTPPQNKFWNTTNIFFGLALVVGGFLVVLFTKLNSLEKTQDGTTRALDKNEIKIELISNDIKDIKYTGQSLQNGIAEIKEKLRKK